jgi:putative membrane protein
MVIPGVSGSMILLILGYYNPIIETINKFIRALSPFNMNVLLSQAGILIPFGIGVVIGIFAIAKLIEFLLSRFEKKTYFSILGLVLASPAAIYMGIGVGVITVASVVVSVITFSIGFAVAFFLGKE